MYDGSEHTPKLLPCSHTVCLHCLTRIAASQTRDTGTFRCPICRELITIPRGGVSALPPSFLVNQLLDLMSRQRREVIPKCSIHINQVGMMLSTYSLLVVNILEVLYGILYYRNYFSVKLVTLYSALCVLVHQVIHQAVNTQLYHSRLP